MGSIGLIELEIMVFVISVPIPIPMPRFTNGRFFNREITMVEEIHRLRNEINRVLSKEMLMFLMDVL